MTDSITDMCNNRKKAKIFSPGIVSRSYYDRPKHEMIYIYIYVIFNHVFGFSERNRTCSRVFTRFQKCKTTV